MNFISYSIHNSIRWCTSCVFYIPKPLLEKQKRRKSTGLSLRFYCLKRTIFGALPMTLWTNGNVSASWNTRRDSINVETCDKQANSRNCGLSPSNKFWIEVKVKVTAWYRQKGLVAMIMHAKYQYSFNNISEDISQIKGFCDRRTDRQTDE